MKRKFRESGNSWKTITKSEQSKGKDVILYNEFDYGFVS